MAKEKILIVDDEEHIRELLRVNLESAGYEVVEAETGEEALIQLNDQVALVVLDYMLPQMDGLEVLRTIRKNPRTVNLPVLMLTARNEEIDAVLGLEMGADDYIGKPFRVREFLARVKAALRRNSVKEENGEISRLWDLEINRANRTLMKNKQEVALSLKEFELIALLSSKPGRVFSRDLLLQKIWGYDFVGETRTVDVHIRQLRKKIEDDDKNPAYILTVRGLGYKFREMGK
ncbi:response regulator transcription factor [Gottschalkiaceae bacterium SANA]|nr:response regulator transcription factor [Gottschalkiaceae bacterium SANA]